MVKKKPESIRTSMTLPSDFLKMVDKKRGDIPRSKFILKMLKDVYYSEHNAQWSFGRYVGI